MAETTYINEYEERSPYGMDKWYPLLEKYTIPSILIKLSNNELLDLYTKCRPRINNYVSTVGNMLEDMDGLPKMNEINDAITHFNGVFVRIDQCSPKYIKPCSSCKEIYGVLLSSERTLDVIKKRISIEQGATLFLREFVDFTGCVEFRIFIWNKRITTITQNNAEYVMEKDPSKLFDDMMTFISPIHKIIIKHYDKITIDVSWNPTSNSFILVECNTPFDMYADTGLFSYPEEVSILKTSYMGHITFRYIENEYFGVGEYISTFKF